jgi:hypothetical protein
MLSKSGFYLFFIIVILLASSCGKKTDDKVSGNDKKRDFSWHDDLTMGDIPDFPIKGYLDGKEVTFAYINFEKWRGSNDNVLNFSMAKPEQTCGFIERFSGFTLLNKGAAINKGEWVKSKFSDDPASYQATFKTGETRSSASWNCALEIESITEKSVTGKIALFFNDDKHSWLGGKFEASVCNN